MVSSISSSDAKESPEALFWQWFDKNQDMLFHFEKAQERTFDKLRAAMSKVHPRLTFEFGPDIDGKREFIISADGMKDAFPAVESLYATAPVLPRWKFIKFRPRRSAMTFQMGNLKLEPSDLEVAVEADGSKAGFTIFVKGYNDAQKPQFDQAAFLMLDAVIGEHDMETKVGFIEIKPFEQKSQYKRHSLADLPQMFDAFMAR
jgi:hypothetical protein